MSYKERLESYLQQEGVSFYLHHHPAAFTAQQVAQVEHVPGMMVAKVVVVFADGQPVMLVVPAPYRVSIGEAGKAIGATVARLATETELAALFPDCQVGAMPPFGNLYDLPVYVDQNLAEDEMIVFQAGTHVDSIGMKFADFVRLVHPTIGAFAHQPGALVAGKA